MTTPVYALTLELQPSQQLRLCIFGGHALAILSLLLLGLTPMWLLLCAGLLAAHGFYTWNDTRWLDKVHKLRITDLDYQLIDQQGVAQRFEGRGYIVTAWLIILEIQVEGRKRLLPLLPDSSDTESLRRLRVALRCRES